MFPKVLFAIAAAALIGAALLSLRHQRLVMMHEMAQMHQQIDQARRETWDYQAKIAEAASPAALREAIERAGLELEPLAAADVRRQRIGDGAGDATAMLHGQPHAPGHETTGAHR